MMAGKTGKAHLIFPVIFGGTFGLVGLYLGLRTVFFNPDFKYDKKSRNSPIVDNRREAEAYRSHYKRIHDAIGDKSYIKPPPKEDDVQYFRRMKLEREQREQQQQQQQQQLEQTSKENGPTSSSQ